MIGATIRLKKAVYRHVISMIGNILRKEREKQKLSIRDVENETSIRTVYIDAIEKGEYDKLPGEVYAKGFIKNYGNFLNLNGEDLVRQFVAEISAVANTPEEIPAKETQKNSIAATNVGAKYQSKQQINSNDDSESEDNTKKYLVAAVAFIAILVSGIFYNFSGSDEESISVAQSETPVKPVETPIVETSKVENANVETQSATAEVAQAENVKTEQPATPAVQVAEVPANGVNLSATFSDNCWTRVIVDGAMVYEGMITAGNTFDWKGNQNVSVLVGNAGAAQFVMNGETVGALGAYGDVVEKTFTR